MPIYVPSDKILLIPLLIIILLVPIRRLDLNLNSLQDLPSPCSILRVLSSAKNCLLALIFRKRILAHH